MLVTKTRAAELAGVSRRTFYNHIPQKKISVTLDEDGTEKVDVSELERIYGKEVIARNLKDLVDREEEGVSERATSREAAQGGVNDEVRLLREKLAAIEESKAQLETFSRRERELLTDEIDHLRESLKKAQDHQSQLSLLLTDQRDEKDTGRELQDRKLAELEKTVGELRKMNGRVLKELRAERSKGFWRKVFG